MEKPTSISLERCNVTQLKTLLGLATIPERAGESLPTQIAQNIRLSALLTELCHNEGQSGDLLLTTVCDAGTSLEVLRGIKELAKRLLAEAPTDAHRDAATVLYHAAIAAGVAHHGINMSSRPLDARIPLYEDLAATLAGERLGLIFRAAVEYGLDTGAGRRAAGPAR